MSSQTVKCPICGKPYVFYAYYAGDQSACPNCRNEARKNIKWKEDTEYNEKTDT